MKRRVLESPSAPAHPESATDTTAMSLAEEDAMRTGPKEKWSLAGSRAMFVLGYVVSSALSIALCYALTTTSSWSTASWHSQNPYYIAMIGNTLFTVFIALWSAFFNNSCFYDAWWSVGPMVFIAYWYLCAEANDKDVPAARVVLVFVSVFTWGIRLTHNWWIGWPGLDHEDWRILDIKRDWIITKKMPAWVYWICGAFGTAMMSQTVFIGLGSYPAYVALYKGTGTTGDDANDANALDYVAAAICVSAATISFVADRQMRLWRANKPEAGSFIDVGLWKYSRHPNYFGEMSFWWGLYLFALAADSEGQWWAFFGALPITCLFVFASIPMMEARSVERRPRYKECINTVSMVVPWFPKVNDAQKVNASGLLND